MLTNQFLIKLSVNSTNLFLFSIIVNSIALSFFRIMIITASIYKSLEYTLMLTRLYTFLVKNLMPIFL